MSTIDTDKDKWLPSTREIDARTQMWCSLTRCFQVLSDILELVKNKIEREEGV